MLGTEIKLPSQGVLYGSKLPEGVVTIRKLTVKEEGLLLAGGSSGQARVDAVLTACTTVPGNQLELLDMLVTDRLAILLALRVLTFGPLYTYTFKCRFCGAVHKSKVDIIADLNTRAPKADLVEPVEIDLPDAKCTVAMRFLRGRDEVAATKYAKRANAAAERADADATNADPAYLHRLARQVVTVKGEAINVVDAERFMGGLSASDNNLIRNTMDDLEPAIDMMVYPDCRTCSSPNELMMPFDAEFFRPTN